MSRPPAVRASMMSARSRTRTHRRRVAGRLRIPAAVLLVLGSMLMGSRTVTSAEPALARSGPGIHTTFETLLERRKARDEGRVVTFGLNSSFPNQLLQRQRDARRPAFSYSPLLGTVFEIGGPGYVPFTPEYYLYDGAYYVYDPPSYQDPSVEVRAFPRHEHEKLKLAEYRRQYLADRRRSALTAQAE
jgi:hypothetical protein